MPANTSIMQSHLGMIPAQDRIAIELIKALKMLLVSNVYLTYRTSYNAKDILHELNLDGQLDFVFGRPADGKAVQNIRAASDAWNSMDLIYRLTVLDAFSSLYYDALKNYTSMERTILFCQIFINDFVDIITSN